MNSWFSGRTCIACTSTAADWYLTGPNPPAAHIVERHVQNKLSRARAFVLGILEREARVLAGTGTGTELVGRLWPRSSFGMRQSYFRADSTGRQSVGENLTVRPVDVATLPTVTCPGHRVSGRISAG